MRILYIDSMSGISGDMTIGSLLDLGADASVLETELARLPIQSEYRLEWEKVVKNGITATKFDVHLTDEHSADHHHHGHSHRHYESIANMIQTAGYNEKITAIALDIFTNIGRAEAKIHNVPLEKVHFHEVGAVDSIIDIVGTAILINELQVDKVVSSSIPVGNGKIRIDHGIYPVPAPATLEILKGVPLEHSTLRGELTTPTGAGIIKSVVDEFGNLPTMTVEAVGYGAGSKTFENQPNVLRLILGTTE